MSSSGKTVLVTGGNGYLGSAVVLHFLEHGYTVHTTVRSISKADGLKAFLTPKYEKSLKLFTVPDMTVDGVYEQSGALKGVDAICHVASPVPDLNSLGAVTGADYVKETVLPAIAGTRAVLHAASSSPQVRHVLITSSAAALMSFADFAGGKLSSAYLTEADWNNQKADDADLHDNSFSAYFASKACAERAAWDYVKEEKPHWTLATFCPPMFYGPAAIKPKSRAEFGSSLGIFYSLMQGETPAFPLDGSFIDVRDIAQAMRLVIEQPLKTNERFILTAGAHTADELTTYAKTLDPEVLQDRPTNFETAKVRRVLGWVPKTKKETFSDMAAYLKEAEKSFTQ